MKESSISKRADKHIYSKDLLDRPQSEICGKDIKKSLVVPSSQVTKLKSTPPRGLTNGLTNGVRSRPKRASQGLTNGLTDGNRTFRGRGLVNGNGLINGNGLTNGNRTFRGRGLVNGNGLTNGNSIFKRKGLVNGNGLINGNGLTNGSSIFNKKGVVNGNGIFRSRGLINGNGIINGNGLTNGNAFEKKFSKKDTGRRMVIVRVFVVVILLMIPWLLVNLRTIPSDERDGIYIDGNLRDWEDVLGCKDAIDDQKDEPSVNILDFRLFFEKDLDRRWEVKLAFYLEVEAHIFGNPNKYEGKEPISYVVHILIDSDNNPDTGYHVKGIGADYMVEIEGHSGVVHTSYLKEFYDSNQKNWNGFEKGNSIPSAIKDRALETQIYLDLSSVEKVDVLFHISDSNGNEDFSDTILSNEEGRLIVTQQNIAPEVLSIGTRDVEFLRLTLEAQAADIEIESLNLTLVGSAQESDIEDISLFIEDRSETLDMDEGIIATATFSGNKAMLKPSSPLKLVNETSTSLVVIVSISPDAVRNRVMGLSIDTRKDVVIKSGTVTLQSDIKMLYIGEIPEEVIIDGAFGEWSGIQAYKDVDDIPMKNGDVDIDEYKILSDSEAISLHFKVKGTMMGGAEIPMVPDYKEYVDIPVPNDNGNSANSDIKEEINPYLKEEIPKELLGEDSLYLFIDSDRNRNTGYCTDWLPVGAEHLIIISGKDGYIVEKVSLTFNDDSNREVTEVISHDLDILPEIPTDNVSWIRNNHASIEAISCSNQLEAKIERKLWGNKGSVDIFFIATNWNNHDIDGENLLSSIGPGVGGTRSELLELVTGIGKWTGDKFGWNVSYAGDVNNDGYDDIIVGAPFGSAKGLNDIVTADNGDNTVSIYNGSSSGGWEAKSNLSVGTGPQSVFIGDANNDGYNDIVTVDITDNTVTIYNGTASGEWEAKFNLSVGSFPLSVFVGDANNDGYNDIVTANYGPDTVTIYNGTSGGWEAKGTLGVGTDPRDVFVADANNDGYNDIITADDGDNNITILNGTASGLWEAKCTLIAGTDPYSVFVEDTNNDGYNDIVCANWNDDTVTIYNGTNDNGWEAKGTLGVGWSPCSVFVGDANNDGYNDIITADINADTVTILNGTSGGIWEEEYNLSANSEPRSVFVADANNDGYNDILAAQYGNNKVTIYNGTASGLWEAKYTIDVGTDPMEVFVANANNDDPGANTGAVYIFFGYPGINLSNINAANANVTIYGSTAGGLFGWSVSDAGDVNGDSKDDVIIGAPEYDDNNVSFVWDSSDVKVNQNSDSELQIVPVIAAYPSGDAIVVWEDRRNGASNRTIYAQKLDSNGNTLWGSSDVKVNQNIDTYSQSYPSVALDPNGNAIIVWQDERNFPSNADIFAQKVDPDGNVLWSSSDEKVNQNSDSKQQLKPAVAVDSNGNAIIVWHDYRSGSDSDIYAQKLDSNGIPQWGSTDVKVNQNSDSDYQLEPRVALDSDGNAIVVWHDNRSGNNDLFAQKLNSTGDAQWGSSDKKVNQNSDSANQENPDVTVDSNGNAIVVWRDERNGAGNNDIFSQKLNSMGVACWGSSDKKVNQNSDSDEQYYPAVAVDSNDNTIFVWLDYRGANDIYTQRFDSNGNAQWGSSDVMVNQNPDDSNQYVPTVAIDSAGNAIFVWQDDRNVDSDIYAQKLDISCPGRAYIFYGKTSWSTSDIASNADIILTGEFDGDKFGCSVSGAGDINYDNYYCDWNYRKKITINASQVADDLTGFPMLVHITDSDLQSKARSDGYDIFFTSSNGKSKLAHEIESYNSSSGELIAWVNIPALSSTINTVIYMYYDNTDADDQQNIEGVWSNNYVGVYHMVEETGNINNSASATNDGTRINSPIRAEGHIGYGQEFDGGTSQDKFNVGDFGICDGTNENISFSAWAKINNTATSDWGNIIFKRDDPNVIYAMSFTNDADKRIYVMINGVSGNYEDVSKSTWVYLVGTYNGSNKILYINGSLARSNSQTGAITSTSVDTYIGGRDDALNQNFGGLLDEIRFSKVARSAEWIETEFNNQNDTGSFYYLSSEEPTGYDDVIVGAYGYGNDQGRAYIFYGPDFNMSGIPYSYAESLTVTELPVTASWEDYLTLTVKPFVSTNYLIIATSDMGPDGTAPQAGDMTSLRLRINNTDTYHEVVKSFDDPTDWYHFSAVKYLTLLPGSHDIELEYKTDGDTGTFRNSRIIAIEMTIPSDQYDENESSVQSTSSEELAAGLTFTPSSSGEYLIIASANVAHTDNKNSVWGRMYIDGTLYGETLIEPTVVTELMNFGVFKNITLDASPHTINLTVLSEDDPGDTSSMTHAHIAAIRVDSFLESYSNEAEAQNAGSGAWETLVTNSYTPTTDGDFIILGTAEWFTNDVTAVNGIRLNTSGSIKQESMVENRDATDKHMTFQMDKRYLSGSQTDTVDHNVLATGWSKFARLITLPLGTTYTILTGEKANDKFGFSVSNAGKVDSDNFYDVIVGAPGGDKAYIFTGDDSMTSSIRAVDANVILSGALGTNFGFSVASCGNINNADGDDVIVGAPGYNANRGRAYIFYGREHNEIVVANYLDDLVFVYDYTVTEDWEAKINQSVGDMPYSVFVGDANNDGYNDILTADYNDNTVTIYNGTSSGGWEPVGKLYVGDSPRSVYVADTNNDSLNDIVTADYGGNTITIYNGTSSEGWESNYTLSTGTNPYSVFVGDANNDGYNDLLAANYFPNTVSLYNGTSSGGWEAVCTFDVGSRPTSVFVGDANDDGYNDILTANSNSDTISIYNGTSGGVWEAIYSPSVGTNPLSVFVGDANNDGYNDILVADRDDDAISIFNGTSSGDWEARGTLGVGNMPRSVFVGDANNDGYNDIVTSDSSSNTITIYNGTSTNDWESKGTLSVGSGPVSVFVGDANNDGRNDILTADSSDDTVTIYNGTGNRDWEMKFLPSGNLPFSVFVGDANNDGYNDILIADNNDDTVSLYNGTSIGGWETKFTLSVGTSPRSVFVADANNDGYNDILTADVGTNTVTIYNGTSSGGWEAKCTLSVGNMPYTVFVADANNDGYNDILTADLSDDNVTIYNGTGSGGWEPIGTLNVGDGPADLYVGDANNDGYNDIVTVDISDYTVTILNGTSSGSWEPKFTLDVGASPYSVFVGDANNDGYNDILSADQSDDTVTIYNGTSSGWEGKFNLTVGDFPYSVFVADANNDGYNDILTADYNDYTVTLYNGTASGDWEDKITLSTATYPTDVFVANANNDVMGGSINTADADLILTGESIGDKFGYSVHYAGDIDGDGYPDVIVGAPYHTNGSDIECGAMYVYCGGSDIDSTADYTNYGENAYDHFGWSVSYAGDINSDNYNDTLCGAPYYDYVSNTDAGKAYCHSTNVIPEFEEIVIPVFVMIMIFVVWRRKRIMKMRPKEIQNRKNRGMVENWNLRRCTK